METFLKGEEITLIESCLRVWIVLHSGGGFLPLWHRVSVPVIELKTNSQEPLVWMWQWSRVLLFLGSCCTLIVCYCIDCQADKITVFSYFPEDPLLSVPSLFPSKAANFHQTFLTGADVLCVSLRVPREKCSCKFIISYQLWLFCNQAASDITRCCKMLFRKTASTYFSCFVLFPVRQNGKFRSFLWVYKNIFILWLGSKSWSICFAPEI